MGREKAVQNEKRAKREGEAKQATKGGPGSSMGHGKEREEVKEHPD
jgi:hypothetical protein